MTYVNDFIWIKKILQCTIIYHNIFKDMNKMNILSFDVHYF